MCVVRRMIVAQVYSVVCWLFGCGLDGLWLVLIVPLFFVLGDARPVLLLRVKLQYVQYDYSICHHTIIHHKQQVQRRICV